jgi:hypothetical protein
MCVFPCLSVQAHELEALVHNFPPSSLPAVITLRDTLLAYADTYPVRVLHTCISQHVNNVVAAA